jgi:hypothetical protein
LYDSHAGCICNNRLPRMSRNTLAVSHYTLTASCFIFTTMVIYKKSIGFIHHSVDYMFWTSSKIGGNATAVKIRLDQYSCYIRVLASDIATFEIHNDHVYHGFHGSIGINLMKLVLVVMAAPCLFDLLDQWTCTKFNSTSGSVTPKSFLLSSF